MIGRFSDVGKYKDLLSRGDALRCGAAALLALCSYLAEAQGLPLWAAQVLALASAACTGGPIILGAAKGLLERRVNVDELVALALTASLLQGEFLTAAVVGLIMALGTLFEEAISDTARRSIQALAALTPTEAERMTPGGGLERISAAEVRPGDRLLVRPGGRVPVDGVVLAGASAMDEASVTGEGVPVERGPGDTVLAGTLSHNGVLEVEAVRVGGDTTFGRVVRLVEEAEAHRPKSTRAIDRHARWFTPLVLACAGLAWGLSGELSRAVAVLVAGCPCALLLAAPTATVAAVARAARSGVLVKGGAHLETLASADAVLFDKTGTLTLGKPRVEEILCAQGVVPETVLALAAGVERHCDHPLARAVLQAAQERGVDAPESRGVVAQAGLGVRGLLEDGAGGVQVEVGGPALYAGLTLPPGLAQGLAAMRQRGATALAVLRAGEPVGLLAVTDTLRPTALATLEGLRRAGLSRQGMLSGDDAPAVNRVAGLLGLGESWSRLGPEDKLDVIARWRGEGRTVLYVGDGVNDAPALAGANIAVAMGGAGTDVALETAGMALTRDDISRLPFLVGLSRRMLAVIRFNVGLGLASNALAVAGGMSGLLSPVAASLMHNGGSLLVVLASAGLLLYRDR